MTKDYPNKEQLIHKLKDDIIKRDSTISELQNHINNLQEEIKELHKNLEIAIENGEEISRETSETIDYSVKKIEAHYSKAAHNIKVDIAKLQEPVQKNKVPKTRYDEMDVEKHRYISQVMHLQNEREKVLNNLNKLEIQTLGYSTLTINSTSEDIVTILDNIRKVFDDKNIYYEQKLLNAQNSYQLLKRKVEEAQTLVEFEKQKIVNERENSKQVQNKIEEKILELHQQLKAQEIEYANIIKDLEAKMLNQKLIFDQICETKESHINKLKEEILKLKEIYEKSMADIEVLQQKLQDSLQDKNLQTDKINELNSNYKEKSAELNMLQKLLDDIENKITNNVQLQTECVVNVNNNKCIQTDIEVNYLSKNSNPKKIETNMADLSTYIVDLKENNSFLNSPKSSQQNVPAVQEVQILTAKIEPSIDFVKNIYQNYKKGRLQTRTLEQLSVSTFIPEFNIYNNEHFDNLSNSKNVSNHKNLLSTNHFDTKNSENVDYDLLKTSNPDHNIKCLKMDNSEEEKHHITDNLFNLNTELAVSKKNSFLNSSTYQHNKSNQVHSKATYLNSNKNKLSELSLHNSTNNFDHKKNKTLHSENSTSPKENIQENDTLVDKNQSTVGDIHNKNDVEFINRTNSNTAFNSPSMVASAISDKKSQNSINMYMSPRSINYSVTILSENNRNRNSSTVTQKLSSTDDVEPSNIRTNQYKEPKRLSTLRSIKSNILDNKSDPKIAENYFKSNALSSNDSFNELPIEKSYDNMRKENFVEINTSNNKVKEKYLQKKLGIASFHKSNLRESQSCEQIYSFSKSSPSEKDSVLIISSSVVETNKKFLNKSVLVKLDRIENYEMKIKDLSKNIEATEKEYKKKFDAIQRQYENHVKSIINEHNQGVKTLQSLHEETLSDVIKIHDTEIENLRTMSIDAMTKVEKLQKENKYLKSKLETHKLIGLDQRPIKLATSDPQKRKFKSRTSTTLLTKTDVEAFNVKPKGKYAGPCTCSLDVNISDTIRNIFEQVDEGQRKLAEHTYLKYIANKLIDNIESLNARELSFLHLKVCRIWKTKLTKEEALKWKIDALESELINKQLQTQKHMNWTEKLLKNEEGCVKCEKRFAETHLINPATEIFDNFQARASAKKSPKFQFKQILLQKQKENGILKPLDHGQERHYCTERSRLEIENIINIIIEKRYLEESDFRSQNHFFCL